MIGKVVVFLSSFAILLALGCGGGGSSTPPPSVRELGDACPLATNPGTIDYFTTWGSSTPTNASQVLRILDVDGNSVRTNAINRAGATTSNLMITAITPGVYEFKATLYSLADANGTIIGETSQVIDLCGNIVEVRTTAQLSPNKINVNPDSTDLTENQSKRFIATVKSNSGQSVFVPQGAIDWTVLGGIGTVAQDGVFSAITAGTGAVRAETSIPLLVAASSVQVNDFVVTHTKWTVLVYINAANNLYWASDINVDQMEAVADNPDVRFVVQWKQSREFFSSSSFDGVRRVLVKPDTSPNLVSDVLQSHLVDGQGNALDMGSPQTMLDFINWGKTNYPADHYALVIWNHGNGWHRAPENFNLTRGFSYDDQTNNGIQTWEMDQAFGSNTFDIIAWDCSLMQMIEVAYEARNYANYIVGSEESPPGLGYPYDLVFAPFRDNPDDSVANLTKGFIDGPLAFYDPPWKITQSSIDTTKLPALVASLSTLAQELTSNVATIATQVQSARALSQAYTPTTTNYRDIVDLCLKLEAEAGMPTSVVNAAADVRAKVAAAIVWEGHNAQSLNSHGISIDFSPGSVFGPSATDYSQMQFALDTVWDAWLAIAP